MTIVIPRFLGRTSRIRITITIRIGIRGEEEVEMEIIRTKSEMCECSRAWRAGGKTVGFVPTMGALHEGHLSLVRKAREECEATVVSLFVNPTQFGPAEDLAKYPRTFDADREACEALGVDVLFAPTEAEMYQPGSHFTYVINERLASVLEGKTRPTHFRGVLTVVLKLFNVVAPHVAYFGQKDCQQTVVIRRMVADLDVPVKVCVLPTVREPDGLAMSSRNRYLNPVERKQAACIHEALELCHTQFAAGESSAEKLEAAMRERIDREPLARIDYIQIVKPDTLEPSGPFLEPGDVALAAVFFGSTRLIDNVFLQR